MLLAACATSAPVAAGRANLIGLPSAEPSGPPAGSPAIAGTQPGPAISAWPSPWTSFGEPGMHASPAPVRTVGADWPATVDSTPDPGFILHVPILMYHRIVSAAKAGPALPGLLIDPAVFAQELGLLAGAGWHTITLATLQVYLATDRRPPPRTFVITIDDGHRDGITNALPVLQRYGFVATYFVVMRRIDSPLFLSAADLQTLAGDGMEIADHTMNHKDVGRLHGANLAYEVSGAAQAIRRITGRAATTFAYPSGEWSLEAVGAVQTADLGMAVTTKEGVLETWANRFLVPRLRVPPSLTPNELLRVLSGYAID